LVISKLNFLLKRLRSLARRLRFSRRGAVNYIVALLYIAFFVNALVAQDSRVPEPLVALFFGLSALVVGVAVLFLATPLGKRGRVAALGAVYLCKIIFFAALHFSIFTIIPSSYVFSSDVIRARSALDLSTANTGLDENAMARAVVRPLLQRPDEVFRGLRDRGSYRLAPDAGIEDRSTTVGMPPGGFEIVHDLYITSKKRASCLSCTGRPDALTTAAMEVLYRDTPRGFSLALEQLSAALDKEATDLSARVSDLKALRPTWTNLDFIYFSTTTETTVGYGDIIPTSAASRMAVMFQVTSGLFFLGFGLSFLWSDENAATSRSPGAIAKRRLQLQRSIRLARSVTGKRDHFVD
jgi:Ion channel